MAEPVQPGPPVLIIPPEKRRLQQLLSRIHGEPFTWIYIGQDPRPFYLARRCFQDMGAYLDTVEQFQQAARSLREPYLTFLYQIGREVKSLRWWVTSLSYRSAYHSTTFQQAAYLKAGLDMAASWEGPHRLVIVAADAAVRVALKRNLTKETGNTVRVTGAAPPSPLGWFRDAARMLVHRAFFLVREGRRIIEARRNIARVEMLREPSTLLFSRFNPGNKSRGAAFHRSFFGDLAAKVGKSGCPVTIVPMVSQSVSYRDALIALRGASPQMLVPHRYLSFLDLLRAAFTTRTRPPLPSTMATLSGMDITPLVQEELRADWISNQAADAVLISLLIRKWADLGFGISRQIYIYENQPWERALCWETRRSLPGTKLVGYQYGRVPELLLNWRLAPGGESEAPLPHRIVTGGPYAARQISGEYEPGCVQAGGALEMNDFLQLRTKTSGVQDSRNPVSVLVAPSIGPEEAAELVDIAGRLFNEEDGIRVVVKCHPLMPFDRISSLIDGPLPSHVEVSEASPIDLMNESAVMLYTSSTICVQALALGLPVIHLKTRFELDMDPLENTPGARLEAAGPEQLRERVLWLLEHRQEFVAEHREQWDRVVDDIYGPVTGETFRAFLE